MKEQPLHFSPCLRKKAASNAQAAAEPYPLTRLWLHSPWKEEGLGLPFKADRSRQAQWLHSATLWCSKVEAGESGAISKLWRSSCKAPASARGHSHFQVVLSKRALSHSHGLFKSFKCFLMLPLRTKKSNSSIAPGRASISVKLSTALPLTFKNDSKQVCSATLRWFCCDAEGAFLD